MRDGEVGATADCVGRVGCDDCPPDSGGEPGGVRSPRPKGASGKGEEKGDGGNPGATTEASKRRALALCPGICSGSRPTVLSGKRLTDAADTLQLADRGVKLTPQQVRTQSIIGHLKFVERVQPRLSLILHRLSCVMSAPPPAAYEVARAALYTAYAHKDDGITYGGQFASDELEGCMHGHILGLDAASAPAELAASGDASWCASPTVRSADRNIYGILLTYRGGAVYTCTKKIGLIVDSSHESEAIATAKAGEHVAYARQVLCALGAAPARPTAILSDNKANVLVANNTASAARCRHFLRRYLTLQRRMWHEQGGVHRHQGPRRRHASRHSHQVARRAAKLNKSIAYATNSRARQ